MTTNELEELCKAASTMGKRKEVMKTLIDHCGEFSLAIGALDGRLHMLVSVDDQTKPIKEANLNALVQVFVEGIAKMQSSLQKKKNKLDKENEEKDFVASAMAKVEDIMRSNYANK